MLGGINLLTVTSPLKTFSATAGRFINNQADVSLRTFRRKRTYQKNQPMSNNPATPTLSDLIKLLDPATLDLLTERLHKVASVQEEAPEQLLFSFIEDSLAVYEEDDEGGAARVAAFLESLDKAALN